MTVVNSREIPMKKIGKVVMKLSAFLNQRVTKAMPGITIEETLKGNYDDGAVNKIHLQMQFSYSKVKPIKEELYRVFEEKKQLEQDMTTLTLGGEKLSWTGEWPDELRPEKNGDEDE